MYNLKKCRLPRRKEKKMSKEERCSCCGDSVDWLCEDCYSCEECCECSDEIEEEE
jgi:hypothetical protein